jgi:hypothetical protein
MPGLLGGSAAASESTPKAASKQAAVMCSYHSCVTHAGICDALFSCYQGFTR